MHHVSSAPEEGLSTCSGEADGDGSPSDPLRRDSESAVAIMNTLPSSGYNIFDERPSNSEPSIQETFLHASAYLSFPIPTVESAGTSGFRSAIVSTFKYVFRNWNHFMLVFVPIGIIAPNVGYNDSAVFVLNCLAIIPLADMLCRATDDVASFLGETTGALVNVTMGNATELVIFVQALVHRQYIIVRTSLLGSIIVNILLVLGIAIFIGEGQVRGQSYNVLATRVAAGLLCLTTVTLLVPSTMQNFTDNPTMKRDILGLSRATSIVLIIVYMVYLWTQIKSTKFAYKPLIQLDDSPEPEMDEVVELRRPMLHRRTISYPRTPSAPRSLLDLEAHTHRDIVYFNSTDLPDPTLVKSPFAKVSAIVDLVMTVGWIRKAIPIVLLMISTGLISLCGEYLVASIDHFVDHSPLSKTMVGLIILPIVGNAAELVSGIMFASRGQMDLAFAVSIGSAIQIALFVTPLIVLIGWGMNLDMSLHFTGFESATLVANSVLFSMLVFDDRCTYLKGACLCAGYTVIALASYFVTDAE